MLKGWGLAQKYEHPGIYSISIGNQLVYIGKRRNMLRRLAQHWVGIQTGSERKYRILAEAKASAPIELDALNDYEIGLITKEDMTAIIGQQAYFGYANARREFKAKYGYTPVKVPVYGIYGFDITNFESEDNNNVSI